MQYYWLNYKNVIFSGDFNVFFDTNYGAQGGDPTLKKKLIAKLIHITESVELCDISRVKNLKKNNLHIARDVTPTSFGED